MLHKTESTSPSRIVILLLVLINILIIKTAFIYNEELYRVLFITLPFLLLAIYDDAKQKVHAVLHNYHMKAIRKKIVSSLNL